MIPLCVPDFDDREKAAIEDVLKSGWLTHGPYNKEFEYKFAEYHGVKYAVSMNSCTSALFLALKAQNITGEVIVPSFTFAASANAIVTAGAKPVFADIDYGTCNIDPESVKAKITPDTEAIMIVHFGGQCCRMDEIMTIAEKNGLVVIEDSAETIGGEYKGKKAGSFATGCFSFFPTKNMTTGEGGMITTNDKDLAVKISALIGHGIIKREYERESDPMPWYRSASYPGYNFRMSNLLAAMGVVQLDKLNSMNERRIKNACYLRSLIGDIDEIEMPFEDVNCKHVFQMFTIKMKEYDRDEFVEDLRKKGVGASVHFTPPVHLQEYYINTFGEQQLPVTEKVSNNILTLPLYPQIGNEKIDIIADAVRDTCANLSNK